MLQGSDQALHDYVEPVRLMSLHVPMIVFRMLCQTGLTDHANHLEYIRPIMKSKDATWLVLFESKSVDGTSLVERICQTVRKVACAGYRTGDRRCD
jgi:hypothetical protein